MLWVRTVLILGTPLLLVCLLLTVAGVGDPKMLYMAIGAKIAWPGLSEVVLYSQTLCNYLKLEV